MATYATNSEKLLKKKKSAHFNDDPIITFHRRDTAPIVRRHDTPPPHLQHRATSFDSRLATQAQESDDEAEEVDESDAEPATALNDKSPSSIASDDEPPSPTTGRRASYRSLSYTTASEPSNQPPRRASSVSGGERRRRGWQSPGKSAPSAVTTTTPVYSGQSTPNVSLQPQRIRDSIALTHSRLGLERHPRPQLLHDPVTRRISYGGLKPVLNASPPNDPLLDVGDLEGIMIEGGRHGTGRRHRRVIHEHAEGYEGCPVCGAETSRGAWEDGAIWTRWE
ncbi:hypothetical protein LTR66_000061 [Elasticomyces elasticus]|nr:hypothetical protein LTR66_000061 [Elasticomyces elasticus]